MMVIRLADEIQMTMSVWLSRGAQEHALIMKNLFAKNDMPHLPEKLSILMHSFAAIAIQQPIIYCQPMEQMKSMLKKAMAQKKIPIKEYSSVQSSQSYHPCRMYGTDLVITNDERLQNIFLHCIESIGIQQQDGR